MGNLEYLEVVVIVVLCLISCFLAVSLLFFLAKRKAPIQPDSPDPVCFLFDGERLIDASISGYGMLGISNLNQSYWQRVHHLMIPRFPEFPMLSDLEGATGKISTAPICEGDNGRVITEWWDDKIRVELFEDNRKNPRPQNGLMGIEYEKAILENAVQGAPYSIWQTNASGYTTWANAAYETLVGEMGNQGEDPIELFDSINSTDIGNTRSRTALTNPKDGTVKWYEIHTILFDDHRMNYAIDVTAVVTAETAQRNFVQTLTKTFAALSIGLAIFDRNRRLALFNPSLIDLTALPADFLSARPNLLSFFDKLRENRMMPEPKNYSSWREQLAGVIAAASDGHYSEIWTLESGQTYRVTGRPHPDGAIAFLFEDISAEISLTQGFRAQLELGQSVLDQDENALAIFSSDGTLTLSNSTYQELWDVDPDNCFAAVTLSDACQHWRAKCADAEEWENLKNTVSNIGTQSDNFITLKMHSGIHLECRVTRLPQCNIMVKFGVVAKTPPVTLSPSNA